MLTVGNIYEAIDTFAPFASQESWDNSGLLVGSMCQPAQRILTTLDISAEVISEAVQREVQLIVAHHPVIFSPLKTLPVSSPVYQLAAHGIAAICVHTPLDVAPEGLNMYAHTQLKDALLLEGNLAVLEPTWKDGRGFGWVDASRREWMPEELAKQLQTAFGCPAVRFSNGNKPIRKVAFSSGSSASLLELAAAQGCDALITGDIKHDRWYAAEFLGLSLFDCGHYGTEQMAAQILYDKIRAAYPEAEVFCMPGADPAAVLAGGALQ